MFDGSTFFSVSVGGIPLIFVVLGLVTWLSKMGVSGKWLLVASLLVGLVLGSGYQISQAMPWTISELTFGGWFAVMVYGLALGLVASGVYETGVKIAGKGRSLPSPSETDGEGKPLPTAPRDESRGYRDELRGYLLRKGGGK